MSLNSYLSNNVYVTYSFTFTPSYFIPSGSTISIALPNRIGLNYLQIDQSHPPAECILSQVEMGDCTISSTAFTTITTGDINEKVSLQLNLTGAKNPNFIGTTLNTDF
jgi:ABC-type transporter Mla subunit MlaD